jgi:hypothetical protein
MSPTWTGTKRTCVEPVLRLLVGDGPQLQNVWHPAPLAVRSCLLRGPHPEMHGGVLSSGQNFHRQGSRRNYIMSPDRRGTTECRCEYYGR